MFVYIYHYAPNISQCYLQVYRGYVDDPRNTDNSWMETIAVNFHDESGSTIGRINLNAGRSYIWAFSNNQLHRS